jgi:hypothetical protein
MADRALLHNKIYEKYASSIFVATAQRVIFIVVTCASQMMRLSDDTYSSIGKIWIDIGG